MAHAGCRLGIVVAVAIVAGACASADRTMANRFVRQGTPSVDLGGPRPVSIRPADRAAMMRKSAASHTLPPPLASLETTDPVIRGALDGLTPTSSSEQYLAVAASYLRRGVFDKAHDYLTRSLAINGPNAAVYDSLARLWRDWGQPAEGLAHAHRAVFFDPKSPVAHNTLGTLLYRLGKRTDARVSFARAVELDPTAWYAFANLCHADMAAGNTRAAINECQKAKALRKSAQIPDTK